MHFSMYVPFEMHFLIQYPFERILVFIFLLKCMLLRILPFNTCNNEKTYANNTEKTMFFCSLWSWLEQVRKITYFLREVWGGLGYSSGFPGPPGCYERLYSFPKTANIWRFLWNSTGWVLQLSQGSLIMPLKRLN